MKKLILFVLVLTAASLVFTACDKVGTLPSPVPVGNENAAVSGEGAEASNPVDAAASSAENPQGNSGGPGTVKFVDIVVVTPSPNGNSVTLNVGDLLVIEIPTIPAEGWRWVTEEVNSSLLMQQGDPEVTIDTAAAAPGNTARLTYLAVAPGSTTLTVEYKDNNVQSPAQALPAGMTIATYSFSVTVQGANKVVVVKPAIKGVSATLKVGDTLVVEIPTIPAAGWTWVPDELNTQVLTQVGEAHYEAGTAANDVGGIYRVTFRAVGKGNISLTLLYVNTPAQDDASQVSPSFSAQSFGMSVIVE